MSGLGLNQDISERTIIAKFKIKIRVLTKDSTKSDMRSEAHLGYAPQKSLVRRGPWSRPPRSRVRSRRSSPSTAQAAEPGGSGPAERPEAREVDERRAVLPPRPPQRRDGHQAAQIQAVQREMLVTASPSDRRGTLAARILAEVDLQQDRHAFPSARGQGFASRMLSTEWIMLNRSTAWRALVALEGANQVPHRISPKELADTGHLLGGFLNAVLADVVNAELKASATGSAGWVLVTAISVTAEASRPERAAASAIAHRHGRCAPGLRHRRAARWRRQMPGRIAEGAMREVRLRVASGAGARQLDLGPGTPAATVGGG